MSDKNFVATMPFETALQQLKQGKKIGKLSFSNKEYLWLLPQAEVKKEWVKDPLLLEAFGDSNVLPCLPSIRKKNADGSVMTGWSPSQKELLFDDDYFIIE